MARRIDIQGTPSLEDYESYAHLVSAVRELRAEATLLAPRLAGRTVWMVNSTQHGGGVAEMMPTLVSLLRELGVATEWVVIESDQPEFFDLTKRIHNLVHGVGDPHFGPDDRTVYEAVNRQNAEAIRPWLRSGDIVVVHDPQPMGLGPALGLGDSQDITAIWRCHIGLDEDLPETRAAWSFLEPYAAAYGQAVFSAAEYIPDSFRTRATLIHPAVNPITNKNRVLSVHKLSGILVNSALAPDHGPVLTGTYPHVVERLQPGGEFRPANMSDDIGLLTRPIVTQVSRWDRLKGFVPLLRAFADLKGRLHRGGGYEHGELHRRRLELVRLVLAGPDPNSVADDPEGLEVIDELRESYAALPDAIMRDIAILSLPMQSRHDNEHIVNAIQRASSIIVQNSLREGFGLTIAEAMWKAVPVLSNTRACGPRQQIRDHLDGRMIDDPEDIETLTDTLDAMLADPQARARWGRTAQRRCHDEFLPFGQVRRWLHVLAA